MHLIYIHYILSTGNILDIIYCLWSSLHHLIFDGWQLNWVEIYIKYVKITVNLLTDYHWCKVLVELFLVLNGKQAAAAEAYEVTLIVTILKMMD